jgi:GTP-binding protein
MAEILSVIMARKALDRADVAVLVIDASEGVTHLDASIAGYAIESGCSIIIAVNKWDLVPEKDTGSASEFERNLRDKMKFLDWAPVVTVSAISGQRLLRLLPLVIKANEERNKRITTSRLNEFFERNVMQPKGGGGSAPGKKGHSKVRVKYITQAGIRPPMFVLFTSAAGNSGLHFSYLRYIENRLRDEFEFFGTPIRIKERKKAKRPERR